MWSDLTEECNQGDFLSLEVMAKLAKRNKDFWANNYNWFVTGKGLPDQIALIITDEFKDILSFEEPTFAEVKLMDESEYKVNNLKRELKLRLVKILKGIN